MALETLLLTLQVALAFLAGTDARAQLDGKATQDALVDALQALLLLGGVAVAIAAMGWSERKRLGCRSAANSSINAFLSQSQLDNEPDPRSRPLLSDPFSSSY